MSFLCLAPGKHCIAALQYVHLPVQVNFLEGVVSRSLSVMSPGPAQRAMPGSLYPLFTQSDSHCMWQSQYRGLAPRALPADWTKSETAEEITGSIWIMVVTVSLLDQLISVLNKVDHEAFGSGGVWIVTLTLSLSRLVSKTQAGNNHNPQLQNQGATSWWLHHHFI